MAYKKIVISGVPIRKEGVGSGTITPGDILERTTTSRQVQRHSTRMGNVAPKIFAVEDSLQGNDIDDNYSDGNRVQFVVCRPGEEIYVRYTENIGWTPAIGDYVSSDGNGTVTYHQTMEDSSGLGETNPPEAIVGICLEAGASGRVRIEIV